MDFKEFLKFSSSSVALLIASASAAHALTITQTVNVNTLLTQGGGTATGQFDITGLLTPPASFNQPYDVVSATITAYGYSTPNPTTVTGAYDAYHQTGTTSHTVGYTYSYSCGVFGWSTCYGYATYTVTDYINRRDRTRTELDNVADKMQLSAGGDTFSGTVSAHDTSFVSSNLDSTSTTGSYENGYNYYYSYTSVVNDILYGNLSAGGALSVAALSDLGQDGILSFSASAPIGLFTLQSLQLDVTVNENASQADLPEPVPAGPMSAGLLLLMLYRRIAGKRRCPPPSDGEPQLLRNRNPALCGDRRSSDHH